MSNPRERYFNVSQTFELPIEEFNQEWALVDNIWIRFNGNTRMNGDKWISYVCRASKPQKSSERQEGVPSENLRVTFKRPAIDCKARIKVTWLATTDKVRIERMEGTPDHSHLLDISDMRKRSRFIKIAVANEAVKDYNPPMITNVVRKEIEQLYEDSGVKYLKTQEVANTKFKLVGPMNTHLIGEANLRLDIKSANKFLVEKNYRVEKFTAQKSQGFCFANSEQLKNLVHYGWLTLIDSTHNTNKHDWHLFTLYIRDGCGCWNVGGHFFVSRENSETVTAALKTIRTFAPRWSPRYMLLDQSSVEANSIAATFPGL